MESNDMSSRMVIIVFIGLIIMVVVGAGLLFFNQPDPVEIVINPPEPTATHLPSSTPSPVRVYVTGAVNQPQTTLDMPAGSRVEDVIAAVGGLSADADLDQINLAAIVRDGDQIHVARIGSPGESVTVATPSGGTIVYINSATQEELETLPGIGPATANAILQYRESNGAFTSLTDLDNVSGIGPATLAELEPLISFE